MNIRFSVLFIFCVMLGVQSCGNSTDRQRGRLAKQFVGCVPDSLSDDHRNEITGLLESFWARADMGKVAAEDVEEIDNGLQRYIDAGEINRDDLLKFMARVGYYTYKADPRFNLPDGVVDHPTLNPDAALIRFESTEDGPRIQMYWRNPNKEPSVDTVTVEIPDTTVGDTKNPSH